MITPNKLKSLTKSQDIGELEDVSHEASPKSPIEYVNDPNEFVSDIGKQSAVNLPTNEQLEQALQRLAQHTQVRVNPHTQDREFLLHRGVTADEREDVIHDGFVHHHNASSWTPSYHRAHASAENMDHQNVLSAWVPEFFVRSMPSMHLSEEQKRHLPHLDEHEVILRPNHCSEVAEENHRPASFLASTGKFDPSVLQKAETVRPLKQNAPDTLQGTRSPAQPMVEEPQDAIVAPKTSPTDIGSIRKPVIDQDAIKAPAAPAEPPEATVKVDPNKAKWGKLGEQFEAEKEERRKKENRLLRRNMKMVKNPGATGKALDVIGHRSMPDDIYSATNQSPVFKKTLQNGLIYSVVESPDKTKAYHFLTTKMDRREKYPDAPETLAAVEIENRGGNHVMKSVYNRKSRAGQMNMPVLLKYAAKYHKAKKLHVEEIDPEKHGTETFKTHNPEVIKGLSPIFTTDDSLSGVSDSKVLTNKERTKKAIVKEPLSSIMINSISGHKFTTNTGFAKANSHWNDPNFNTSHREAAYDKMARDFFGLGEYIPKTTAFVHPASGNVNSAQEWMTDLPNQHDYRTQEAKDNLGAYNSKVDLQKIALMDVLLGNTDRHSGNYMVDKNGEVRLIDHGLTFDLPDKLGEVNDEDYVGNNRESSFVQEKNGGGAVRAETKEWINSLSPVAMSEKLKEAGVPKELADRAVYRLESLKSSLKAAPHRKLFGFVNDLWHIGSKALADHEKKAKDQRPEMAPAPNVPKPPKPAHETDRTYYPPLSKIPPKT